MYLWKANRRLFSLEETGLELLLISLKKTSEPIDKIRVF